MEILRINLPYNVSGEKSWMPFGVKRQARIREISGELEETILTLPKRLASEYQCLSLSPIKSGIQLAWDVRSRLWALSGEKGSVRMIYSGIGCGGLTPVTTMHGKKEQIIWSQGPSIQKMIKGV